MKVEAFILSDKIKVHDVVNYHYPVLWQKFNFTDFDVKNANWSPELKYLTPDLNDITDDIKHLPNDAGGIYIFFIKGEIIPQFETHLAYVGRAQLTKSHNLRVRCKKYFSEFFDSETGRPQITRLIGKWGQHLYLRYLPLTNNDQIKRLEAALIRSIMPPFNEDIPDKIVKQAVSAF
jgi:hypothetical protein